jgi:hypothetical protein
MSKATGRRLSNGRRLVTRFRDIAPYRQRNTTLGRSPGQTQHRSYSRPSVKPYHLAQDRPVPRHITREMLYQAPAPVLESPVPTPVSRSFHLWRLFVPSPSEMLSYPSPILLPPAPHSTFASYAVSQPYALAAALTVLRQSSYEN